MYIVSYYKSLVQEINPQGVGAAVVLLYVGTGDRIVVLAVAEGRFISRFLGTCFGDRKWARSSILFGNE